MEAYLLDWANLLLRWLHVVTVIAWIGSSFYFVFLDNSLVAPQDAQLRARGVTGELWAVHGGGFYNPQKYAVAPQHIPGRLHWFYWESYATWLSGFALFALLYLWQAKMFLVDPRVHDWSPLAAGLSAVALLALFWLAYDSVCKLAEGLRGTGPQADRVVGALALALVVLGAWLACRFFAGRAAFMLTGAMMATAMSANVFLRIIPGQRRVMAQLDAGLPVDPLHGQRARQRSVHNTYFTLPVLVAMLSNHHGFLYGAPHNWLVLVLLMAAGALIRHFFVARHRARVQGRALPWGCWAAGAALLGGVAVWLAPARDPAPAAMPERVGFAQVQAVVAQRCVMCHGEQVASKNVQLHTPQLLLKNAQAVYQQAVVHKSMPMNNASGMTEEERALVGRWFRAGADGR